MTRDFSSTSRPAASEPTVSVIMPAFNRRAVITRAVRSVIDQTFEDWELIVVDDGSTDGTADVIDGIDPRVKVVRGINRGAAAARNSGVSLSRGRYIAFLDSDDEWLPHFLALTHGFLERNPDEHFVATESIERAANGETKVQDLAAIRGSFVRLARFMGSNSLDLPPGIADDYRRVYSRCDPLEDWWQHHVAKSALISGPPRWYRGNIGPHYRWGYFHALWCILYRSEAVRAIGPFNETRRSCNDFAFLALLCQRYSANMLTVPSVIKHELRPSTTTQMAGHLASGAAYFVFAKNYADAYNEVFSPETTRDPETRRLYAYRCLAVAREALWRHNKSDAEHYFTLAAAHLTGNYRMRVLRAIARFTPRGRVGSILVRLYERLERSAQRIRSLSSSPPAIGT